MTRSFTRFIPIVALFLMVVLACNLPSIPGQVEAIPQPPQAKVAIGPVLTVAPDATPTATPFQPVKDPLSPVSSATIAPQEVVRTPEECPPFPPATQGSPIDLPIPVCPQFLQPENQFNVLLLGSDQRPNSGGFRTDTMILVTLNPDDNTVNMTSFPRDLYVYIPGWTMQRINTAQARGGFPQTQLTYQYNFGVRPDRYVMINFWSFRDLISSLGGIDVEVARPLSDHRAGFGNFTVPAGTVRMDADTALWYVRSRYSTSDFDRTRRQQEVIVALFNRLISLDVLEKAPEIYELYKESVETDLTFADMAKFIPLAGNLISGEGVERYYIGREQVTSWRTPGGAQVLLPNRPAVLDVMRQALNVEDPPGELQ
ncbi:MAG: LCP family protein [Anaerolineales bacterium]|nr:LCP family protein [Anaerolineales bacterium]